MTIIQAALLRNYMNARGCLSRYGFMIADRQYVLPAKDWLYSEFADSWTSFLGQLDQRQWSPEANDCDNFARMAASWASLLNSKTPNRPAAELAFGEFWYTRDQGGGHAINFALVANSPLQDFTLEEARSKLDFAFLEPQNSQQVSLSGSEIQSCTGFRI